MSIIDRLQAVMDFLRDFRADKGVMPLLREIQGDFKFASSHVAQKHLQAPGKEGGNSKKRGSGSVHDDDWNGSP